MTINGQGRILTLCLLAIGSIGYSSLRAAPVASQQPRECDYAALGRAAAQDTVGLRRVQARFPSEESVEGAQLTAYMDDRQPRVIILTFLGELGKAVIRYSLATAQSYVIEREDFRYAAPINIEPSARIVARLPTLVYICEGVSSARASAEDVRRFQAQLDAARAIVQQSAK